MSDDFLIHYGKGHLDGGHSGRYPWGSGEEPFQHEGGIRAAFKKLKDAGFTEKEISEEWQMSINQIRNLKAIEKAEDRNLKREKALALFEAGKNYTEIAREMGTTDNSIRSYLDPIKHERNNRALNTAKVLKNEIDTNGMTMVGAGMANRLGISDTALKTACEYLELDGYKMYNIPISQNGTAKTTSMKVIAPPGMTWSQAAKNKDNVNIVKDPYSEDGGRTWENIEPPMPVSSKRVYVRYKEDGGADRDGLIEIRRGVKDLDLGKHGYAQVRIAVSKSDDPQSYKDGTNYMKGVAIYSETVPKGYDIVYNSNKSKDDPFDKVYKKMERKKEDGEIDWDNPFKANIKANKYTDEGVLVREIGQKHYIDDDGNKKLSPINIVNEAGDWAKWSKNLSSQFLSKQNPSLAKNQLQMAYESKERELKDILALENPEIKMKLLDSFADDCDSASVHLKASPLPKQQSHVLIPVNSLRDNECYAPNYKDGTIVSLVRHPHGGIFEIPTLIVNNNNPEAKRLLGLNPPDAIGVNIRVAQQLSGADFDGDTVIVLPNKDGRVIKSSQGLKGLKDFETKMYTKPDDAIPTGPKKPKNPNDKPGDGFNKQREMGRISNLITDMTLAGATPDELCRAVKHSMVIIDAEKHNLDWRASEKEYNIQELRKKYQPNGGVATLISRAKSPKVIPERANFTQTMVDKDTGKINWRYTNRFIKEFDPETKTYKVPDEEFMNALKNRLAEDGVSVRKMTKYTVDTDRNDRRTAEIISDFAKEYRKEHGYSYKPATKQSTKMEEVDDAYSLSSGTTMESVYANYANSMKALGNKARKIRVNLEGTKYDKSVAEAFAPEISSINAKINKAMKNKPLERKVQAMADVKIAMLMKDHPDWGKDDRKKHRARIVRECRQRMGTQSSRPKLTEREWLAVKNGGLTQNKIKQLFSLMDVDDVREYATPRNYESKLSKGEIAYAKAMINSGNYKTVEIADFFGISVSTLNRALNKTE